MNRREFFATVAAALSAPIVLPAEPQHALLEAYYVTILPGESLVTASVSKMDLLWGLSQCRPEFACRICDDPPEPREWIRMKFDPARLPL